MIASREGKEWEKATFRGWEAFKSFRLNPSDVIRNPVFSISRILSFLSNPYIPQVNPSIQGNSNKAFQIFNCKAKGENQKLLVFELKAKVRRSNGKESRFLYEEGLNLLMGRL